MFCIVIKTQHNRHDFNYYQSGFVPRTSAASNSQVERFFFKSCHCIITTTATATNYYRQNDLRTICIHLQTKVIAEKQTRLPKFLMIICLLLYNTAKFCGSDCFFAITFYCQIYVKAPKITILFILKFDGFNQSDIRAIK